MGNKIPLGTQTQRGTALVTRPTTNEEILSALQRQVQKLTASFYNNVYDDGTEEAQSVEKMPDAALNMDGIPIGVNLVGVSTRGGACVLTVENDHYRIGDFRYDSLSAAAEAVSGVRRSGWSFWKTTDGRSVKDTFGRT